MRWYIGKALLDFKDFFFAEAWCAWFVILFEVLYLLKLVVTPLNSLFGFFRRTNILGQNNLDGFRVGGATILNGLLK
jgi:hypothetical protein